MAYLSMKVVINVAIINYQHHSCHYHTFLAFQASPIAEIESKYIKQLEMTHRKIIIVIWIYREACRESVVVWSRQLYV